MTWQGNGEERKATRFGARALGDLVYRVRVLCAGLQAESPVGSPHAESLLFFLSISLNYIFPGTCLGISQLLNAGDLGGISHLSSLRKRTKLRFACVIIYCFIYIDRFLRG